MDKKWSIFCCNPFKRNSHWIKKDLRSVSSWMIDLKQYDIKESMKICTACRLKLGDERKPVQDETPEKQDNSKPGTSKQNGDETEFMDVEEGFNQLNASLTSIGESPVVKKKCASSNKYCKQKIKKIKSKLDETFFFFWERQHTPKGM